MAKLLKFEFHKLVRRKALYICSLIIVLVIAVTALIFSLDNTDYSSLYLFITSLSGSSIDLILPILIAITICNDNNNGAMRTIIGRGYNHKQIYFSKYIISLLITFFLALVCWATSFIIGVSFWGLGYGWNSKIILILIVQLNITFVISTISFFFATLLGKSSYAIALGIFLPTGISLMFSVMDAFLTKLNVKISDFWIASFFMETAEMTISNKSLFQCFIFSSLYILFFLVAGYFLFPKKEF